jgi:hypothetical protein
LYDNAGKLKEIGYYAPSENRTLTYKNKEVFVYSGDYLKTYFINADGPTENWGYSA